MRPGTTLESLAKLKPAFEGFGKAGFEAVVKAKYLEFDPSLRLGGRHDCLVRDGGPPPGPGEEG